MEQRIGHKPMRTSVLSVSYPMRFGRFGREAFKSNQTRIARLNLILVGGIDLYGLYAPSAGMSSVRVVIVIRKWKECWAMTIQVRESILGAVTVQAAQT